MQAELEIILIAITVAVACAIPGVFLVLRKMSLMSDAISHSVLLGIVLGFFLTRSITSPLLILGAALVGIATVTLTEILIKTKRVKEDAAIGLVFPLLFSIAVILITKFAENVHIDSDAVLLGEIAFAPFSRFVVSGIDLGPKSLWLMGVILLINLIFMLLFYKELKLATFDAGLAASLGFAPALLHYGLMTIVSITAVGAFDVVGSILVVALIIAPPATAYLLTEKLWKMIVGSILIGAGSAILGYGMAFLFDVSISGSMATIAGALFFLAFLFAPHRGFIVKLLTKRKQKVTFATHMLAIHLLDHENTPQEKEESKKHTLYTHMRWTPEFTKKIITQSKKDNLIEESGIFLKLTNKGRKTARDVMTFT